MVHDKPLVRDTLSIPIITYHKRRKGNQMAFDYETISTALDEGVLTATISNPPINVMTLQLYQDLVAFTSEVQDPPRSEHRDRCCAENDQPR